MCVALVDKAHAHDLRRATKQRTCFPEPLLQACCGAGVTLTHRQHSRPGAAGAELHPVDEACRGADEHLAAVAGRGHIVRTALYRHLGLVQPLLRTRSSCHTVRFPRLLPPTRPTRCCACAHTTRTFPSPTNDVTLPSPPATTSRLLSGLVIDSTPPLQTDTKVCSERLLI